MSDTVVSLLTAPGVGAIATIEVRGPRAWELAKQLFTPAGKPLPESPEAGRFWFGNLGNDEVVMAACGLASPHCAIEVHCHGGPRVVRMVIDHFLACGCIEEGNPRPQSEGFDLLQHAPTLRTASILLDQVHGAFANEVSCILAMLESDPCAADARLHTLANLGNTVGRHLVEPWKVVIAGPPNVGKSSLVNALAGYQRAVVSEVAGTTRDAVSVRVAFDGWPVELIDTAGLRDAEGLEAEGIERAQHELAAADLVLWVCDACEAESDVPSPGVLVVLNKLDLMPNREAGEHLLVSAIAGHGVPELVTEIANWLVPHPPAPGASVPFTPRLVDLVEAARAAIVAGQLEVTACFLRDCHSPG